MNDKADSDDSNGFNDMPTYATWICCILDINLDMLYTWYEICLFCM
jgi:hypothetical protein